jgi:hypothetical protein
MASSVFNKFYTGILAGVSLHGWVYTFRSDPSSLNSNSVGIPGSTSAQALSTGFAQSINIELDTAASMTVAPWSEYVSVPGLHRPWPENPTPRGMRWCAAVISDISHNYGSKLLA